MAEQEEKKVTKKEEAKAIFELVEYPTQTAIAFRDNSSGVVLDDKQVLLQILNDLALIKKSVV